MSSAKTSKKPSAPAAPVASAEPVAVSTEKKTVKGKVESPAPAAKASPSPSPKAAKKSPGAGAEPEAVAKKAKAPKVAVEEKVNESVVVNEPAASSSASEGDSLASVLTLLQKQNHDVLRMVKEHTVLLNQFFKTIQKERRVMQKAGGRKARRQAEGGAPSKPSGFQLPVGITPTLCKFLGVAEGTTMSRTDVTGRIFSYIKEHNLQNAENKRLILPDAKLMEILSPLEDKDVSTGYTYLNLQHYLKGNYIKATPAAAAEAGATTSA